MIPSKLNSVIISTAWRRSEILTAYSGNSPCHNENDRVAVRSETDYYRRSLPSAGVYAVTLSKDGFFDDQDGRVSVAVSP